MCYFFVNRIQNAFFYLLVRKNTVDMALYQETLDPVTKGRRKAGEDFAEVIYTLLNVNIHHILRKFINKDDRIRC